MADAWDQFPDAPASNGADPWAQFPDAQAKPVQQSPQPEQPNTWGQAIKNVAGGVGNFATGMVGGLVGDVVGLGAQAYDITANAIMHPLSGSQPGHYADPAAVRERVANFLTYQPAQPGLTQKILSAPGNAFSQSGEQINQFVTDKTGNPYLGDIAGAAPIALANYMGARAAMPARGTFAGQRYAIPERVPGTPAPPAPEITPQEIALKNAREAGLKIAPDKANAPVGTAVGKLAGHAELERSLSLANAPIVDNLAKKNLGVPANRELGPGLFNEIRQKANQPYAEISKTGRVTTDDAFRADINKITDRSGAGSFAEDTPAAIQKLKKIYGNKKGFDSGDAVAKIRQLRSDASSNIKAPNDPEKNALGHAQRAVADALDAQLARHLEGMGKGDLAKRYADARVQLAKLHSVEDAFDGGHVSGRELLKQKNRGVPLTGELKLIADSYEFFDRVMQEPSKIRAHGPLGALDYFIGIGSSGIGAATSNPALAAAVLARPAARFLLGTKAYQRSLAPKGSPKVVPSGPNKLAIPATQQRERKAG